MPKSSDQLKAFRHLTIFILLLQAFGMSAQNTAIITGKVKDTGDNPIEYVNVFVRDQNASTITDKKGNYTLEISPGDEILLEASFTTYEPRSVTLKVEKGQIKIQNFTLQPRELEGVTITDNRNRGTTLQPVPIKDIKLAPTPQQGIEGALTSQLGVRMNNELSSNYSVRGGSFAENLVYVNDIEVYRPLLARSGEQEGLSFPNPDMVGSIYFSAGGFDARYGDKMSSVLDIQYRRPSHFGGSFSASLLGGSLSLENQSKNGRFSQITGVRYRTNQYLLGTLDTQGDYQPNFADVQTYFTYDLTDTWEIGFLGNYSNNQYRFVPGTRETQFGSINEALRFTVFFEGEEVTSFETFFGAITSENRPNENTRLKFTASAFRSFENETFDILGEYFLDELERDLGDDEFGDVVRNRGIGGYLEHGRNRIDATVISLQHRGFKTIDNKYLQWGVTYNAEEVRDRLSEWTYIDSAGYSTPTFPADAIVLQDVIKASNTTTSNRVMGYVQNRWDWQGNRDDTFSATLGVRAQYWDYNNETVVSPRGTVSWKPRIIKIVNDSTTKRQDVVYRFSTGYYYQPPFYRELRDIAGNLNPEIRAQRAIHFVAGADINFEMWNRPFVFITEAYYKALSNLVPYEIDNVRLRYYGNNDSKGYATGLDMKINGEFIPGIESWATLSFLSTQEDIQNDQYTEYYNSEGEVISPGFSSNTTPVDSATFYPGYIPRPTDQRVYFSLFFQDEMPSIPSFKVHLSVLFGSGLPFGPPDFERYKDVERFAAYRRVDIGFSKDLMPKVPGKGMFRNFKTAVVSLEVWNLFDINNTISYTWIRESGGRQYGVPNFLTSRRLNLKFAFSF